MFKKITFQLIKDPQQAWRFWEFFTPRITVYDEWELRYCFYEPFKNELFFYVGYLGNDPIGLLPLQLHSEGYLEFFGGNFANDNRVFLKPGYEKYLPLFYKNITQRARLKYIDGQDSFTKKLPIIDYQYTLSLDGLLSSQDYIKKYYKGETKKKFIKRVNEVEAIPHGILINNYEDIELLFQLNIKRFEQESAFLLPHRQESFRSLLQTSLQHVLITYIFNGKKCGVSYAIIYKDRFVSFNGGYDSDAVKNIDAWTRLKRIDYAIEEGLQFYDALSGNCGWKENWHFTKIPQYKFEIN
jgi:hypothetical protein